MTSEKKWGKDTYILLVVVVLVILYMFHVAYNPSTIINVHSNTGIDTIQDGDSTYIVQFKIIKSHENDDENNKHEFGNGDQF